MTDHLRFIQRHEQQKGASPNILSDKSERSSGQTGCKKKKTVIFPSVLSSFCTPADRNHSAEHWYLKLIFNLRSQACQLGTMGMVNTGIFPVSSRSQRNGSRAPNPSACGLVHVPASATFHLVEIRVSLHTLNCGIVARKYGLHHDVLVRCVGLSLHPQERPINRISLSPSSRLSSRFLDIRLNVVAMNNMAMIRCLPLIRFSFSDKHARGAPAHMADFKRPAGGRCVNVATALTSKGFSSCLSDCPV